MLEDLDRIQQRFSEIIGDLAIIFEKQVDDILKNDPSAMQFIKGFGMNMSGISTMPRSSFDPYRVLGLDKSASDEQVKKRYREMLHRLHPDTAGFEGSGFLLQMVLMAYQMIKRERESNLKKESR